MIQSMRHSTQTNKWPNTITKARIAKIIITMQLFATEVAQFGSLCNTCRGFALGGTNCSRCSRQSLDSFIDCPRRNPPLPGVFGSIVDRSIIF
jgi:hypothetical protein